MAARASDEELRGQGSRVQRSDEQVAEGLGGVNVQGFDDPRTHKDPTKTGGGAATNEVEGTATRRKPTDPDWVHRKEPEEVLKVHGPPGTAPAAAGVGYDPGSGAVSAVQGTTDDATLPKSHELGGRGNPESLGLRRR